jgi:hypothetical protein
MCGAMKVVEIAFEKNWLNLWLELDSSLVVATFENPAKPVAWLLRNRWKNVMFMLSQMNCIVTHIFREGNSVADLLANYGLTSSVFTSWSSAPLFISVGLSKNKLGSPSFRLCSS